MTVATITEGTSGAGTLYTGVLDTRIKESASTTNYSSSSYLEASSYTGGDYTRSILQFPGLSNISGPVTVSSASLFVRCSDASNGTNDFDIHRIKLNTTVTQATWAERQTGVAWTTAGAYDTTDIDLSAAATASNVAINTWAEFTGAGLVALVEGWINGTISNYGVLLKRNGETSDTTFNEFQSSQAGDSANMPYLTVDYTAGAGATVSTITGTTVTEGTNVVFTVNMSGTGGGSFAYSWSGTATSADYTTTLTSDMFTTTGGSGSVVMSGSNVVVDSTVTAFTVSVPTSTDTLDEDAETVRLVLGGVTASSGTIADDDAEPSITGTTSVTVDAGDPVVITYTLSAVSGRTITRTLTVTDGTATGGGVDYTSTITNGMFATTSGSGSVTISGSTVTIPAGVIAFTLSIPTTA